MSGIWLLYADPKLWLAQGSAPLWAPFSEWSLLTLGRQCPLLPAALTLGLLCSMGSHDHTESEPSAALAQGRAL